MGGRQRRRVSSVPWTTTLRRSIDWISCMARGCRVRSERAAMLDASSRQSPTGPRLCGSSHGLRAAWLRAGAASRARTEESAHVHVPVVVPGVRSVIYVMTNRPGLDTDAHTAGLIKVENCRSLRLCF